MEPIVNGLIIQNLCGTGTGTGTRTDTMPKYRTRVISSEYLSTRPLVHDE